MAKKSENKEFWASYFARLPPQMIKSEVRNILSLIYFPRLDPLGGMIQNSYKKISFPCFHCLPFARLLYKQRINTKTYF